MTFKEIRSTSKQLNNDDPFYFTDLLLKLILTIKTAYKSKLIPVFTIAIALASAPFVSADVVLSKLFGDHMVLQQNQPIPIWGKADPGEQVTAEFAEKTASVKAAEDRRWRIDLPPMKADGKAHTLRLFAKSPCVKGRANEWRVQGVMRAWMNIHNRRITQELPLIRRDWS